LNRKAKHVLLYSSASLIGGLAILSTLASMSLQFLASIEDDPHYARQLTGTSLQYAGYAILLLLILALLLFQLRRAGSNSALK
jgi:hypothetical protein